MNIWLRLPWSAAWVVAGGALLSADVATALAGPPSSAPVSATRAAETGSLASGAAALLAQMPPQVSFALKTLGFGGIAGWAVGYTLKKFAKAAALLLGTVIIALQILAYHHFVTIHWEQIQAAVPPEELQNVWIGLMSIVTYNFPFAGAFAVGFYLGFAKG
ncbi:MAG: hypothetical protein OZSIB_2096 [Candidatus Ozemobacter sibiricus]|uniref:FUN14 family protein n=1 Tax=Candidatus Ozemobacter sibiricus TaxID=2268124 RepID=A0A367ZTP8_9BACT|nr:MAG: hypothetical protein OZSIB_2096 [Candidatus Ozemobacter sibiricus]